MNFPKRLLVLASLMAVGFSTVFLLPKVHPMRDSRLGRNLPAKLGEWEGRDVVVGEKELKVLAQDTGFERKSYSQRYDSTALPVEVSIVFSGKDLNNSIHRPETCLKTQGWDFVRLRYLNLPGSGLPVKEMLCKRVRLNEEGKPVAGRDGKPFEDWQLLYYTFIGHSTITPGHYKRTFADIRDRVAGGYDQTWAYATFSAQITGKYEEQGVYLRGMTPMDIDQTGKYLDDFIGTLMPKVLAPPPGESGGMAVRR